MHMSKDLKLSYILFFIFTAVLIAWRTLMSFFSGVGINFVALVGLAFAILLLCFNNKKLFSRIRDLFFIACGFCVLEIIIYFAFEFGTNTFNKLEGFLVLQNIITVLGMLFFIYLSFRFVTEMKNIRIKFIEIILGNEKRTTKIKKAKEISNGCLEEKPNKQNFSQDDEIVIETEE